MTPFPAPDPGALPVRVEHFTGEFLTAALQEAGLLPPGTRTQVVAEPLTAIASFNGQMWRLSLTYRPPAASAPTSLILKLPTADATLHARTPVLLPGQKEVWFYTQGAAHTPVSSPACYYGRVDPDSGASVLLLQDLAPAGVGDPLRGCSTAEAVAALDAAARLHARWWGAAELPGAPAWFAASHPGETALVQELFHGAWPRFKAQPPFALLPPVVALGDSLQERMEAAEELLTDSPHTLIHGDFRAGNLLFDPRRDPPICWLIDWEDLSRASALCDVAWFMGYSLDITRPQQEAALLRRYHSQLQALGVGDYPWEACWADYRRAMVGSFVQGVFMATDRGGGEPHLRHLSRVIAARFSRAVCRLSLDRLVNPP